MSCRLARDLLRELQVFEPQAKTKEWMSANSFKSVAELLYIVDVLNGRDDIAIVDLARLRSIRAKLKLA